MRTNDANACRELKSVEPELRHFRHFAQSPAWRIVSFQSFADRHQGTPFGLCRALLVDTRKNMFRISTLDTAHERTLMVEGRLVGHGIEELAKAWQEAGSSLEGRRLVLDLTHTTVIGPEAEKAIFQLMKEGATFSCSDVLTKHLLKQLAHRCNTRLQDVLTRKRSRE
jgi:hypothetical protein